MFNSISGTVTSKLPASLYIENNGIEWDILVPSLSLDAFGPVGAQTKVYIWLYHREDQMRLFGFSNPRERDLFIDLMKVDGVGPKQAIKILSSIAVKDLEAALDGEDVGRLESAPGIGKKTAQKMILALKGKLTHISETGNGRNVGPKSAYEDIVVALANMGYDRKAAIETVENSARDLEASGIDRSNAGFEQELFHRAIVALSS